MTNYDEEITKNKSIQNILLLILLALLLFLLIGVSFAVYRYNKEGSKVNTIKAGEISIVYNEIGDGISILDAIPISDTAGMALRDIPGASTKNTFKFSVSAKIVNNGTLNYEIAAIKKSIHDATLPNHAVKLYLAKIDRNGNESPVMQPKTFTPIATTSTLGTPQGAMILDQGTFNADTYNQYVLKMWIDLAYVPIGAEGFSVTVDVRAKAL